jgi:hypothetical protein
MKSSVGLTRENLFDQLCTGLESASRDENAPASLGEWAANTPVILDGRPFSFNRHEYLFKPYTEPHPHEVHLKAAQLGLTVLGMLRSLYSLRYRSFKGVLYLFPSAADISDFSRARVKALIQENPNSIGSWLKDTDSVALKRVGDGHLYLRGMVSRVGLKSVPADLVCFDELDEARDQSAVEMAIERMAHSEFKEVMMLSNPSLPDYGIDRAFQETDQHYWLLKCPGCGRWCNLVEDFPGCLQETDDRTIRVCVSCGKELDISRGEWVAKRPGADRRGYQHSQLHSTYVRPSELLRKFRTARSLSNFYNLCLGLAYVEAENRLTVEEVLALCGDCGIASQDSGPCYMGVDQGRDLHVTIAKRHTQKSVEVVHLAVFRDWEELDALMNRFSVVRAVVDALPEMRNARAFAQRHQGKVFLNFYNEHQKGAPRWDEKARTVFVNRTESLDASHRLIQEAELILPRECDIVRTFASQVHNVAKKLEEDEESGSKRYVYVRLGEDHFRHAFNYSAIAMHELSRGFFSGADLS